MNQTAFAAACSPVLLLGVYAWIGIAYAEWLLEDVEPEDGQIPLPALFLLYATTWPFWFLLDAIDWIARLRR